MESIPSPGVTFNVPDEGIKVIKDKPVRRPRPAVKPMLHNDGAFVFERPANPLQILVRENLSTISNPFIFIGTKVHGYIEGSGLTPGITRRAHH